MQTKAYFASSVPAALEVARQELGENALLVSSKPAPPHARHYGRLEVTFAWEPAGKPDSPLRSARMESKAADNTLIERLATAGFSPESAAEIAACAARRSGNPDLAVVDELASRIPTAPFIEVNAGESRTLAFIGPPGRGKTTSMIKIAVNKGLARHTPVRIYSAGAHAMGAAEQTARFATILGTPFQSCESLSSLNIALSGESWKGLTLIDTPGISPADRHELNELKEFFEVHPEIEKHLALRAEASSADMLHMISRFSGLAPSRLLFTGLDEAVRLVSMIETLIRADTPATFAGTGQRIPDDLDTLHAEKLARAVWVDARITGAKLAAAAAA